MSWLLSYLCNALWQIPLLFAAAWIAARMLRRVSPRAEHHVWVAALLAQFVLPACHLRIAALWQLFLQLLSPGSVAGSGAVRIFVSPAAAVAGTLRLPFAFEAAIVLLYACVVFYLAGRLAWGLGQTRILARDAVPITLAGDAAGRWMQHCRHFRIGVPPQIAISPRATCPVAIGLRRGIIVVPPHFLDTVKASDLDAVLAHELAHIARRDFAKNLLYSLVSLPVAWHPFLWRTRARQSESRELVCDAAAADAVAGRRQYAQSLLRLAAVFTAQPHATTLHALGILDFTTGTAALERRVMTLTRKHLPLTAARRVLLATACGVLALATCTTAFAWHADVALAAPPAAGSHGPVNVSPSIMAGQRISGENPTYPKEARNKKIQGTVVLNAIIDRDGVIKDLNIVKSPDKLLSDSAMKAVRTWRYRPYLLNGDPVDVKTTIHVVYNLGG